MRGVPGGHRNPGERGLRRLVHARRAVRGRARGLPRRAAGAQRVPRRELHPHHGEPLRDRARAAAEHALPGVRQDGPLPRALRGRHRRLRVREGAHRRGGLGHAPHGAVHVRREPLLQSLCLIVRYYHRRQRAARVRVAADRQRDRRLRGALRLRADDDVPRGGAHGADPWRRVRPRVLLPPRPRHAAGHALRVRPRPPAARGRRRDVRPGRLHARARRRPLGARRRAADRARVRRAHALGDHPRRHDVHLRGP